MKKISDKLKGASRGTLISLIVVLALGVMTGAFLAISYIDANSTKSPVLSDYSEEELRGKDLEEALKLIDKKLSAEEILSEENGAVLLFALAENNFKNAKNFVIEGKGNVLASIANQSVYSISVFDGNTFYHESISGGLMAIADQIYFDTASPDSISKVSGKNVAETEYGLKADYTGEKATLSAEEYLSMFGNDPLSPQPYIVSKLTAKSVSDVTKETSKEGKKLFTFSLELDPNYSTINYKNQVKATSGLSDYPVFSKVSLTVTIDQDFNFYKLSVYEEYVIKYSAVLTPTCKGSLDTFYSFGSGVVPEERIVK